MSTYIQIPRSPRLSYLQLFSYLVQFHTVFFPPIRLQRLEVEYCRDILRYVYQFRVNITVY